MLQFPPPLTFSKSMLVCLLATGLWQLQRYKGSFFFFFSWQLLSHTHSPEPLSSDTCLCFGLSLEPVQNKVLKLLS